MKRFGFHTKALFFAIALLATSGFDSARVFAVDHGYSLNDVIFFSSQCSVGVGEGSSASLTGNDNIEKALRYYVGKGLTVAQSSGILGNYMEESQMNPRVIEGGAIADDNYKMVHGVGFGIAQWTWPSRQDGLTDAAKKANKPITDLGVQLDYSWKELSERANTLRALKATSDPGKAARIFHDGFEGSADDAAMLAERVDSAKSVYSKYRSKIPDNSTNSATAESGAVCTGSGGSKFVSNFTIYDQNDPKWGGVWYGGPDPSKSPNDPRTGTIASAGCGPSAMAMAITALTGRKVTPKDTAEYGRANGTVYNKSDGSAGGSWQNVHEIIGSHWGLKSQRIDIKGSGGIAKVNEGLRKGGVVIMSAEGPAPFTDAGHFIIVRAVTDSGKWLLGDSNGKVGAENSKKEWEPSRIKAIMNQKTASGDDLNGGYAVLLTK